VTSLDASTTSQPSENNHPTHLTGATRSSLSESRRLHGRLRGAVHRTLVRSLSAPLRSGSRKEVVIRLLAHLAGLILSALVWDLMRKLGVGSGSNEGSHLP